MSDFSEELELLRAQLPPKYRTMPSTRTPGWYRAFEEMEDDDEREQAFAFSLGFRDAGEYHAETDWCDRVGLMVDWYEGAE